MTVVDHTRPVPADAAGPFPPRKTSDGRSFPFRAAWAGVSRLRTAIALRFRTGRNPDAGRLTDRQLADIGLTRFDIPGHRDWRR
ncbi:DUF1127 domain-containing protein [Lichenibacterium minor]|uniref:DUF1127 domain-containing protein n=1 Tax=Lichenibacterium minor TaxID=2316528 RepID=A0A4Q2UCN3_9HYPH|nr:DUF1127 domain-containing protein [Lichenibacterium minor]RYC32927.1 DUF1127 domain-containing protein [Lichenibacterium minor]